MRTWTGLLALTFAAAVAAAAGAGQPPPPGPHMQRGPGGPPLERALQLTADQQKALKALREEERETVRPLFEQVRPLDEQLRQALDSGAPDPTSVGQLVIQIHVVQQQIKAAHEAFQERFVALLTPEQREQYKTIQRMMGPHDGPGGHGPMGPPFGPPPPPPGEGPGEAPPQH